MTSKLTALFVSSTAAAAGVIIKILCYKWFIKLEKVSNPLFADISGIKICGNC